MMKKYLKNLIFATTLTGLFFYALTTYNLCKEPINELMTLYKKIKNYNGKLSTEDKKQIAYYYDRANKFVNEYPQYNSDTKIVEEDLRQICFNYPDFASASALLGKLIYKQSYRYKHYYDENQIKSAEAFVDSAIKLDPDLYDAYITKGYIYLNCYIDIKNARLMAQKAEKIRPNHPETKSLLSKIEYESIIHPFDIKKNKYSKEHGINFIVPNNIKNNNDAINHPYDAILYSIYMLNKYQSANFTSREPIYKTNLAYLNKIEGYTELALKQKEIPWGHYLLSDIYYEHGYELTFTRFNIKDGKNGFNKIAEIDKQSRNYYLKALKEDPDNIQAKRGLQDLNHRLIIENIIN